MMATRRLLSSPPRRLGVASRALSAPAFEKPAKSLATATFDWQDPLALSASLTEEELAIYETARNFAQKELLPGVVQATRAGTFDRGIMSAFGQLGLLGLTAPTQYGGGGAGYVAYGLCARAVEQVDSGYRSAMSVQSSLVMHPIATFGSDAQKEQWLPSLASGEKVGCFGLTEPDHGSDPSGMKTRATWDADAKEWVLTGSKTWITNSPLADVLLVWARADADGGAVRGFVLDRAAIDRVQPGALTTPEIEGKLSLRASTTGSIFLEGVRVPHDAMLPLARGLTGPFTCLNSARYGISWGALGAAEACVDVARDYTLNRMQFGAPLAAQQLIQKKLADAVTEIGLGFAASLAVGRAKVRDPPLPAPVPPTLVPPARPTAARPRPPPAGAARLRSPDDLSRQAQLVRQGARDRARVPRHARRQRHRRRVPRDAPRDQPRDRQHVRGHARRPRAHPRRRDHRRAGLRLRRRREVAQVIGPLFIYIYAVQLGWEGGAWRVPRGVAIIADRLRRFARAARRPRRATGGHLGRVEAIGIPNLALAGLRRAL